MENFNEYSKYYDLLYKDKNYSAEADYVFKSIQKNTKNFKNLLEIGMGTGSHALKLKPKGLEIIGIELSEEMTKRALENNLNCINANVINFDLKCKFDACVALFHVVSYLTENTDLIEAFKNINKHLIIGGVFLFDVWNTPAVYNIKPEVRVKKLSDEKVAITRIAQPEIDTSRNIVDVNYEIIVNNLFTNKFSSFSETHKMRHFGFQEIDLLGKLTGFEMIANEEWITGNVTSENTWGVCYIMKKNRNV
jgi:SAM-dependent methyltransferase